MDLAGGCGERRVQPQGQLLRMQRADGSSFWLPASPYSLLFIFSFFLHQIKSKWPSTTSPLTQGVVRASPASIWSLHKAREVQGPSLDGFLEVLPVIPTALAFTFKWV